MIAYIRGWLDGSADGSEAPIRTHEGRVVARTFSPPGGLVRNDEVVAASATIAVGVLDRDETALLGPWPVDGSHPAGPLGLASTPVILMPDAATIDIALAAVARAGRGSAVARVDASTSGLGLALLAAADAGADILVMSGAMGLHIDLVRILGGRAVVALASPDPVAIVSWFQGAELGADLPLPTANPQGSADIAALRLESVHQLVQVDPTPALDEAGVRVTSFGVLSAAAAGILAGRIAAGNRRWRATFEP